jgi:hypothetical protein
MEDNSKKLTIELPNWNPSIKVDDFLITIGKKQSNSVYHVSEITRISHHPNRRTTKYHIKTYKSDLITMLRREPNQSLFTVTWHTNKSSR